MALVDWTNQDDRGIVPLLRWITKLAPKAAGGTRREQIPPFREMPDHLLKDMGFRRINRSADGSLWESETHRIFKERDCGRPDPIRA